MIANKTSSDDSDREDEQVFQSLRAKEWQAFHGQADIKKSETLLGYQPLYRITEGIAKAMKWYVINTK